MSQTERATSGTAGRYAVIGHPIDHSLSPLIHRQFAQDTGQSLTYDLLPAAADGFATAVTTFFAPDSGARHAPAAGLNVTLPFKEQAAAWVDRLDPAAQLAGAVNTIRRAEDGTFDGFNTDGSGLLADLQTNLGWSIAGARVLLIGAGGASRGALDAVLSAQPAQLVLANRTLAKAQELVAQVAPAASNVRVCAPAEVDGAFDIVINATSASLAGHGALVPTGAVKGAQCYDMLYAPTQTVFSGWALSHGATWAVDGLGMLLEQAAAAFALWRGVRPDTASLLSGRNDLFGAKRAGFDSLAAWLSSDEYLQWQSDPGAASAAQEAGQPVRVEREKRQFIAGAVCPSCREIDRIMVRVTADGRDQVCVACGFSQPAPGSEDSGGAAVESALMMPKGKHERPASLGSQATPLEERDKIQAVRFIDPADNSKTDT